MSAKWPPRLSWHTLPVSIRREFFQVIWLNFTNNVLDFCFQFKNCMWVVSIHLGLYKRGKIAWRQVARSRRPININIFGQDNVVLSNRQFLLLYGIWHHKKFDIMSRYRIPFTVKSLQNSFLSGEWSNYTSSP